MRDDELERALVDVGRHLAYPQPTRISDLVRARLHEPRPLVWWRRYALAPALVTAGLLLAVIAVGSPGVRATAREFLHLRGIDIFPVPSVASVAPSLPIAIPGTRTTLDDARRRVPFAVVQPADLGAPDDVYLDTTPGGERVTLVYRDRSGVPTSRVTGVSALFVEFRGTVDSTFLGKVAGPDTKIEQLVVNGGQGFWFEGAPHFFFYRDPSGAILQETVRLAGNTLVWEQDGVTLRLEAQVSKESALRLAASVR